MRVKANLVRWLVCVLFLTWPVQAKYGGGSGEPNDPYLIYTAEQMNEIGGEPNDWDKHFKLMADIDLSSFTGASFNIIGYYVYLRGNKPFTGVFDGNGHTISNFTYASTGEDCIGLFGYVSNRRWGKDAVIKDAVITDLGLIDPNVYAGAGIGAGSLAGRLGEGTITNCYVANGSISGERHVGGLVGTNSNGTVINCTSTSSVAGEDYIGGLVGTNYGKLVNCYSQCSVDAEDKIGGLVGLNEGVVMASFSYSGVKGQNEVGGLVGRNFYPGEIVDCYSNGDVLGQRYVGGLVGSNASRSGHGGGLYSGTIRNCYSVSVVSGDREIGGLVGRNEDGEVSGSFWDIETSGQTISDGGVGRTTAEMQDPDTYIDAGWYFVGAPYGPSDIWAEPDGAGYPVLWWQLSPSPELPTFSGGTGEPDEPYLISTADELNSIGHNPRLMAAHFKLINDIDLADTEFFIIASPLYPFRGTFDGNGHTISNFGYIAANETYTGFFRYAAGAQIKNLGLIWPDVHVDRGDFHGCLIGLLEEGIIKNCYVEAGSVSGYDYIGGLLGRNSGTVTNCYFTGDVYGYDTVGGLVGENSGTVTNCRSSCSVDGSDNTGGLVGDNGGSVMVSYTNASVTGNFRVGGLVGGNSDGEIVNCYAKGDVLGQRHVGGLVGGNATSERDISTIRNCYSATSVLDGFQPGGLVGNDQGGEVRDSFWDIETSGRTTSHGGAGKTTTEMHTAGTFLDAGWDFVDETKNGTEDIWWILEGQDYPRLWWELIGDNSPMFAGN